MPNLIPTQQDRPHNKITTHPHRSDHYSCYHVKCIQLKYVTDAAHVDTQCIKQSSHPHDPHENIAIGAQELDASIIGLPLIRYLLENKHQSTI